MENHLDDQQYRTVLNRYNIRSTPIRIQLFKAISEWPGEFTKAELLSTLRKSDSSISNSTVALTLILFKRTKIIKEFSDNTFQSSKRLGRSSTKFIYNKNK